jgi:hypothetical protein
MWALDDGGVAPVFCELKVLMVRDSTCAFFSYIHILFIVITSITCSNLFLVRPTGVVIADYDGGVVCMGHPVCRMSRI